MRKVKEVLRLRFGLGLQQNEIARSCAIGQSTVHRYLQKAAAAGLTWPLAEDIDDRRLEELLFRKPAGRPSRNIRSLPDFDEVHRQLQTHKHLTCLLYTSRQMGSKCPLRSTDLFRIFPTSRCRRPAYLEPAWYRKPTIFAW